MNSSHFQRGSGAYSCGCCGRVTRATGRGDNEHCGLCADCFELSGIENHLSDTGSLDSYSGEAGELFAALRSYGKNPDALFPSIAAALSPAIDVAARLRELAALDGAL